MALKTDERYMAAANTLFNLVDESWIPIRRSDSGDRILIGLAELFRTADSIHDLDCAPHERVALTRLLVCLTHAALGVPDSAETWGDFGHDIREKVPEYLARDSVRSAFNLLGSGPRFLQVPIADASSPVDVTKLVFHLATGNNTTLFDHEGGIASRALTPTQAALALLTFQNFHPLYGAGYKGRGPCVDRNMVHTVLHGDNLQDTILSNCLTLDFVRAHFTDVGRPIWELDPTSSDFERSATTSYLGRLVPRHRSLLLCDALDGFLIEQRGLEYPAFDQAREATATLRLYRKDGDLQRTLVDCRVDRSIWRDLHAMLVVRHARANEISAPLNLQVQCRRNGSSFKLWTGGLIAEQAKIIDAVESTFTIPTGLLAEDGLALYQAGVGYADSQSYRLKIAVTEYSKSLKSDAPPTAKAVNRYWHAMDRQSSLLVQLACHAMPLAYTEKGNAWGDLVRKTAREAFEDTCPRQTPRQIRAFAAGLKKLSVPKLKPEPK
jgi:CRISPR system Cascade subunit CasA